MVSMSCTDPCGPPDDSVDVTTGVTSVLNKFRNLPGAPIKARSDLDFNLPDNLVNISDVTMALNAFGGFPYPFDGPPLVDPCP